MSNPHDASAPIDPCNSDKVSVLVMPGLSSLAYLLSVAGDHVDD